MREMDYKDKCNGVLSGYSTGYATQRCAVPRAPDAATNHESRITNHESRKPSPVSQRLDRIEVGCFYSGAGPENDSDERADQQAEEGLVHGDDRWDYARKCRCISS